MAGKVRHLTNRSGRYFARLVVPKDLRPILGKTELRSPLGGDYRAALKALPGAVADLQRQITAAERRLARSHPLDHQPVAGRYPMTPAQIAASHYAQRLALDERFRDNPAYAAVGVDDGYVAQLRAAVAGRAGNNDLARLVGRELEFFRQSGNHDAEPGSPGWREIARAVAVAELEFLGRMVERDVGDFAGRPENPMIAATPVPADLPEPVSITGLWKDYVASRVQIGFMKDGGRRQDPVIANLRKFLGHDDARRVERKDLLAWRDHLLPTLSAKTVEGIHLSTIRSLFGWAVENERLGVNPAATVRQPKPRKVRSREPGYTDAEAVAVLRASRSYQPVPDETGRVRETHHAIVAKQWVPLLAAFTGARVSEITQLRREDLRQEGGRWIARITPDAGSLKAGDYRDVPLHPQIITEGFLEFVQAQPAGPLFHSECNPARYAAAAQRRSNKVSEWLRKAELTPDGLQPNHAWRHRLKSQGRDLGADPRIVDAVQGHAGRTSSDDYGDVSLAAKARVIDALPSYPLARSLGTHQSDPRDNGVAESGGAEPGRS